MLFNTLIAFALIMSTPEHIEKGILELEIANIRDTRGVIRVGLFNKEAGFPDQEKVSWSTIVQPQKGRISLEIPDLPYGNYAIAIYHDLNNNGRLDKNVWGIPTEPYGFSNSVRAKWSQPSFGEAAFSFPKTIQRLTIALSRWEEL